MKIRKFLLIPVMALVLLGTMVSFGGTMYSPSPAHAQGDLSFSVEVPETVAPGEDITWRATIGAELGDLDGLSYKLVIPADLEDVRLNHCPGTCDWESLNGEIIITCLLGEGLSGFPDGREVEVVTVTAHVPPDYHLPPTAKHGICATAKLWKIEDGPSPTYTLLRNYARKTILVPRVDLRVQKMVKPEGQVPAGRDISYLIIVENLGPSEASNVNVRDLMFTSAPGFDITAVGTDYGYPSNIVTDGPYHFLSFYFQRGTYLPPGETDEIFMTAECDDPGTINNKVWVSCNEYDPIMCNNVAHTSIDVIPQAGLSITKSVTPADRVDVCGTLEYTITVRNGGPSTAHNVVVRDVLPAEVSLESVSDLTCIGSLDAGIPGDPLNPLTVNLGNMPYDATASFTVTVRVKDDTPPGTILFNGATVSSDTPETDNSNNSDSESVATVGGADVSITKTAAPTVYAGHTLTYNLTVDNGGTCPAKNVVVKDVLPEQVTMVSVTVPGDASYNAGVPGDPLNPLTVNLGSVSSSEEIIVVVKVKNDTPDETIIFNNASVTSDTPDIDNGNNLASVATEVIAQANLGITKSTPTTQYRPYQTMVYTVEVTNAGPCDAFDVVVIDYMPPAKQAQYLYATADVFQDGPNLICKLGDIPSGGSKTFEIYMQILPFRGYIDNNATVTCPIPDPVPGNNNAPTWTVQIIS